MASRASTLCLCALALVGSAFAADPKYSELEPIPGLTYTITNPGEFQAKTGDYEEVKLQITKGDLSAYDEVEMRLCFSTADIKDRPWRKFNDVIKKDKQCKTTADDAALKVWKVTDMQETEEFKWPVKDNQPVATRSFILLGRKDGEYTGYMGEGPWTGHKFVGADAPSDKFVKVKPFDGLESGITVAAIIMSIVSVSILIAYFAYERLVVAKRE